MQYTDNYSLKKPEAGEYYNVDDFNDNADTIDGELAEARDIAENHYHVLIDVETAVTYVLGAENGVLFYEEAEDSGAKSAVVYGDSVSGSVGGSGSASDSISVADDEEVEEMLSEVL